MPLQAAIFDLDGTMVDNNPYHILSWQEFYKRRNRHISEAEYKENINGKTNADVLKYVFANEVLSDAAIVQYTNEKEGIYRTLYANAISEVNGLTNILQALKNSDIAIAMATSGIPDNINFFFKHIAVQQFFKEMVNSTHITYGKPHPEIYLTTANKLGLAPSNCVAFEDSVAGINAAKAAGMKVVALATTHTIPELQDADIIINDFTEITIEALAALF